MVTSDAASGAGRTHDSEGVVVDFRLSSGFLRYLSRSGL